jgi:hypothetical protein
MHLLPPHRFRPGSLGFATAVQITTIRLKNGEVPRTPGPEKRRSYRGLIWAGDGKPRFRNCSLTCSGYRCFRTRLYGRETGWLAFGPSDGRLETRARDVQSAGGCPCDCSPVHSVRIASRKGAFSSGTHTPAWSKKSKISGSFVTLGMGYCCLLLESRRLLGSSQILLTNE